MIQWIRNHKHLVIISSILSILIALNVWDFLDPPMWWQHMAQDNKRAILAYVNENYPGAEIMRQSYSSTHFNPTGIPHDFIVFQYDNVQFSVAARKGEYVYDTFAESKASQFIENEYLYKFFNMGTIPQYQIYFRGKPCDDLSEYTGLVTLFLISSKKDGYNKPDDMAWAYDFYVFWKENCIIPQYVISFTLHLQNGESYGMDCSYDSNFSSEDEFYDAFELHLLMNTKLNQQQSN